MNVDVIDCERTSLDIRWPPHQTLRAALMHEKKRTGIGAVRLLKAAPNIPCGLTPKIIQRWFDKSQRTAVRMHIEFALSRWTVFPTIDYTSITPAMRKKLQDHAKRTGVGHRAILSAGDALPDGISASMVAGWMDGRTNRAIRPQFEYIWRLWESLPDAEYVDIAPSIRKELIALQKSTGIGPHALLSRCNNIPSGLYGAMIKSWQDGKTKSARRKQLDFVLERWRKMTKRVPITNEIRTQFNTDRRRTGIGAVNLFRLLKNPPEGLSAAMIGSWFNGTVREAREDYLNFVLVAWAALPDNLRTPQKRGSWANPRRNLTDSDISALRAERDRTRIGPVVLLRLASNVPDGLTPALVSGLLNSKRQTVRIDHYDYVLSRWRSFPTCKDS